MTDDMKEQNDWTWHQALPVEKGIKYGVSLCLLHQSKFAFICASF